MKAPLRVLLVTTLVSIVVICIALYRYGLLGNGIKEVEATTPPPAMTSSAPTSPQAEASQPMNSEGQFSKLEAATKKVNEDDASLHHGKELYEAKTCALCHGADGKAETPTGKAMNATNLASGIFHNNKSNKASMEYILDVIENGVPGTAMVSFKAQIPDEKDRKDLAKYVDSLASKK
jgi:mono/diheme cytochrome c family protein